MIQGTAGTDCAENTLCFLVTGSKLKAFVFNYFQSCELYNHTLSSFRAENVDIWGTKGAIKSVTVTGPNNAKAVIPLVVSGLYDCEYTLI